MHKRLSQTQKISTSPPSTFQIHCVFRTVDKRQSKITQTMLQNKTCKTNSGIKHDCICPHSTFSQHDLGSNLGFLCSLEGRGPWLCLCSSLSTLLSVTKFKVSNTSPDLPWKKPLSWGDTHLAACLPWMVPWQDGWRGDLNKISSRHRSLGSKCPNTQFVNVPTEAKTTKAQQTTVFNQVPPTNLQSSPNSP